MNKSILLLAVLAIPQANATTITERIIGALSGPVIQRGPAPIKGDVWKDGAWWHCVQRPGDTASTCYRLVRQPPPPT